MNVLKMPRQGIFAELDREVSHHQQRDLSAILERRVTREPLAYILGYREFYGINLFVNSNVLIPRQETETLVDNALSVVFMGMDTTDLVIADVGTGCGAIAINLAIHLPLARVYALDVSDDVLDVASYNIKAHNVSDRVTLGKGGLLDPLPEAVDLIVANLPYIPSDRIPTLQPEVKQEPWRALDGGSDGLDHIRGLLGQAPLKVKGHAAILLELDPDQVLAVGELAKLKFPSATASVMKDLGHLDRVFVLRV